MEVQLEKREVTEKIIGAAFEVYRELGYGFLERVYQRAMQVELQRGGLAAEIERRIQVKYKGAIVAITMPTCWSTALSWSKSRLRRTTTPTMNHSCSTS